MIISITYIGTDKSLFSIWKKKKHFVVANMTNNKQNLSDKPESRYRGLDNWI